MTSKPPTAVAHAQSAAATFPTRMLPIRGLVCVVAVVTDVLSPHS
jgi:hypothetical protein